MYKQLDQREIQTIMNTNFVMVDEETHVDVILSQMRRKKISSVVVVEHKKPKGIISERDLLYYMHSVYHIQTKKAVKPCAKEVMVKGVVMLPSHADFVSAFELMRKKQVNHILVVDSKKQIQGILDEEALLDGFAHLVKHLDWKIVSAKLSIDECVERLHELGFLHE